MKDCSPSVAPIVKGDRFNLNQCPRNDFEREQMKNIPYVSVVGSLMYAQVCTRPDIAFAIGMLGRYQSNQGIDHWRAAKKVLRSTSGYIFMKAGGAISWRSVKQTLTTTSTMEAEFVSCFEATSHDLWRLQAALGEQTEITKGNHRSSCFIYKGKLSLYTPNTIASHNTCKGLRKSYAMVNVIRYRGSTSRSNLSTGSLCGGDIGYIISINLGISSTNISFISLCIWSGASRASPSPPTREVWTPGQATRSKKALRVMTGYYWDRWWRL
ncbi:Retrovirus-related Pol polyprotein from transposon TNT 1-94 [Glycine soja]|uniref:Retrovirus-related Pol polyprotein from transposon TNT 1-94 n=1 Tax=Glycine soja TaxID=3848 RepID=A0A445IKH0_GLYSO|nr:Retrovirus-related Pol polyprotein from transposon TNT 1-94 [Glycine soja]